MALSMDLEGTERVDHLQRVLRREDAILELSDPGNLTLVFRGENYDEFAIPFLLLESKENQFAQQFMILGRCSVLNKLYYHVKQPKMTLQEIRNIKQRSDL